MGHMGSDLAPHFWQIDAAEKRADKAEQEYKAGDVFFRYFFREHVRVLSQHKRPY